MMGADEEVHEVHAWGNRVGGGSLNNPYLQDRRGVDVVPRQGRAVEDRAEDPADPRVDRARVVAKDLQLVRLQNDELQRSHASSVRADDGVDADKKLQYAIQPEQGGTSPLRQASFDLRDARAGAQPRSARWCSRRTATPHAVLRRVAPRLRRDAPTAPFGTTEWHVAEDFITELMADPSRSRRRRRPAALPRRARALADRLLSELRADIADDWVDALEQVPSDHVASSAAASTRSRTSRIVV